MATDDSLSHTIDDDITFEKVRHMPRRTQFVSTHRQLTWQHEKQVKKHERDQKISDSQMSRAKILMADKLTRLQGVKKQMERQKSDPGDIGRRHSASARDDSDSNDDVKKKDETSATTNKPIGCHYPGLKPTMKHSQSTPSMKTTLQSQPSTATNLKQACSASPAPKHSSITPSWGGMKHSQSASAFPVSTSVIPERSDNVDAGRAAGRGFRKFRMLSFSDAHDSSSKTGDQREAEQQNRMGRRATIAEGARETSKLPPHLLQKLAEFMDKTEAFLLTPRSATAADGDDRKKDDSKRKDTSAAATFFQPELDDVKSELVEPHEVSVYN